MYLGLKMQAENDRLRAELEAKPAENKPEAPAEIPDTAKENGPADGEADASSSAGDANDVSA
jgi:hypothetical protein